MDSGSSKAAVNAGPHRCDGSRMAWSAGLRRSHAGQLGEGLEMSTVAQSISARVAWDMDGLELQCPCCHSMELFPALQQPTFVCNRCRFLLTLQDGIWRALPEERLSYFSQFLADYQMIRAAEGRGSNTADYYVGLPYKDSSGKNSEQWKIRASTYSYMEKHILRTLQERSLVLDLGAGNGWMSYRLAQMGFRTVAVDLLLNDQDGLGAANHFRGYLTKIFPRFQAESTRLPFASSQFDAIIFNASFHYAENYATTLREAMRCLKDNGMVIIADTPWYSKPASGERMLVERRAAFLHRFGTASD